ncbi:phage major capsid protein [Bacillus altitudinis]|uniref:phage major capsid protein n=1 Tax=Bacillus altitudinis TaxID=293387 RepID=UPI0011E8BC1E|nr:phage major capsid protein [Bacillus altitudinis]TYS28410.1 phage major capsid protein [Bacillus altitudinis]
MLKEKIQELRSEITKRQTAINTKIKEAHQRAEEDKLEEAKTIKDEITSLKAEIETMTEKLKELEELAGIEQVEVTEGEERSFNPRSPKVNLPNEIEEIRSKVNDYIRSYGQTRDGLKTIDAEPIIPVEILTTPQREPEDVVDLASMVNKKAVKTASGTYPVIANAKVGLVSVAELEKNPELGKPEFKKVRYDVETYRGELPISQESIDDAGVDLTALVAEFLQQTKRITTNRAVANVLKTFTKKSINDVDNIKYIENVALKQAYKRDYVASASAFQWLDTLKDKNGRYLLQQDITSPSGKSFLGKPLTVVDDELLGSKAGDMVMFIGDLKAGVFFADRVDVTAKWVENRVYGQVLSIATRFDAKKADENAGFYVTIKPIVELNPTE